MDASDSRTRIAAVAYAAPPCVIDQKRGLDFMKRHYEGKISPRSMAVSEKLFSHPSIERRHFAFEKPEELLDEDPDRRMERFTRWSVALSAEAAAHAMAEAGVGADDVRGLVVNTCTGYICPGVSTYLVEALGLPRNTRAYDLVGSGCGGAVPNLQLCDGLLSADEDNVVVSVSVEICSATYQMGDDPSLIVSNAIFGDAAAAAVLWRRPQGLQMVESATVHAPEYPGGHPLRLQERSAAQPAFGFAAPQVCARRGRTGAWSAGEARSGRERRPPLGFARRRGQGDRLCAGRVGAGGEAAWTNPADTRQLRQRLISHSLADSR